MQRCADGLTTGKPVSTKGEIDRGLKNGIELS